MVDKPDTTVRDSRSHIAAAKTARAAARAGTVPAMPDRYADAVRARRAELRALRELLAGGHRAELRTELATVKVAVAARLGAALTAAAREFRGQVERADRHTRAVLPELLLAEVADALARERHAGLAAAAAAVRRTAAARSVPFDPAWPAGGRGSPRRWITDPPPLDGPPGAARALLAGVAGSWRLALVPLAALPVVGIAGPALLPLAVGTGIAAVVAAGRARAVAHERARLRQWAEEVLAGTRARADAELVAGFLELERTAGADLDAAVAQRRGEVESELAELAVLGMEARGARG
jgi:hypothetical protein